MARHVDRQREAAVGPSSSDEVVDLIRCSVDAAVVGAGLELGLFWLLDADPRAIKVTGYSNARSNVVVEVIVVCWIGR